MVKAPTKKAPKLPLPSWQCRLSKEARMNQASENWPERDYADRGLKPGIQRYFKEV